MGDISTVDLIGYLQGSNDTIRIPSFIKWRNTTIGKVNPDRSVSFLFPKLNLPVALITDGKPTWSPEQFKSFLEERIPSRSRRDIEKILRKCGLIEYDVFQLAVTTRGFNARDLLWLAYEESEDFDNVMSEVFKSVFIRRLDLEGDSVNSPEGVNIKRYAVSNNAYGVLKKRLHPYSTDVESEVAVYEFSKLLGVKCCPSWLIKEENETLSFSKFEYNFSEEFVVHVRRLMSSNFLTENLYQDLINRLPEFKDAIRKMIILDFITRQTDRHLSNMALKVIGSQIEFYPLYDNGRSLFYEDQETLMYDAVRDIELYSSEFGPVGTYFDAISDICKEVEISTLVNLNLTKKDIRQAYAKGGLTKSRLDFSVEWTHKCLKILKNF